MGVTPTGVARTGEARTGVVPLVELRDVGHTYRSLLRRPVRAVDGISLTMHRGEVMGIAGPNGAGKSTILNLLLGYLNPTEGEVRIGGLAPRAFIERHGIGYLSELVHVPPRWRTDRALRRYALLAGVPAPAIGARVEEVIARLGLGEHRRKLVKQLSKGNLQRLGLAQALLADETVLVLDEPTHGLDPVWTQRFREIVEALRHPARLILVASHNLDELQRVADRVAIIDRGRLQRVVSTRAAEGDGHSPYRLVLARGGEHVAALVQGAQAVALSHVAGDPAPSEWILPALDLPALNALLGALLARGAIVRSLAPVHSELEQQFREVVHP